KENAWHLFRTHKRGERSQRRAGGGRAGTVSAGGWGLGRKLPAVDHVCSDARGPSCCSFTIGQIGGITEQRSRLCARSISRPRRKPHLPPLLNAFAAAAAPPKASIASLDVIATIVCTFVTLHYRGENHPGHSYFTKRQKHPEADEPISRRGR